MSQIREVTEPATIDFPVVWPDPEDARRLWIHDRMHYPDPVAPLAVSLQVGKSRNDGHELARADLGVPYRMVVQVLNGYVYHVRIPISADPAEMAELGRVSEELVRKAVRGLEHDWSSRYLPEILRDVATLRSFDFGSCDADELVAHLDWILARRTRHWHLHFVVAPLAMDGPLLFLAFCRQTFQEDESDSLVMLQGQPNRTVDAAREIWKLGRVVAESLVLRQAINSGGEPDQVFARLARTTEGRTLATRLREYLEEFGWRGDGFCLSDRTWIDNPREPLELLRRYASQGEDASPELAQSRAAVEANLAIAQTRERLAEREPEARKEFEVLLHAAQVATVLHEDHNYYLDQMLNHLCRRAFVEASRRLVIRGMIDNPEDGIYLTAEEIRSFVAHSSNEDLRAFVGERRLQLERLRKATPPPTIGTPLAEVRTGKPSLFQERMMRFFGGPPQASTETEIRGNAGSKGRVTGTARVAMSLADAVGLQSGEILVCPTTAPPWTPLFTVAAAVVTDTGGILSHCAVVAREYGIPAVVGTGVATRRIRTGQRITVDGAAGVVTFE